jgi:hypothetical protein
MPRSSSWVRSLLRPELSGGLGSALGVLMAAKPDLVAGSYQMVFIVLAVVFLLWFVAAFFINASQDDMRDRRQLAQKAYLLCNDLYAMLREWSFREWALDEASSNPAAVNEFDARMRLNEAKQAALNAYLDSFRIPISLLIKELAEQSIVIPSDLEDFIRNADGLGDELMPVDFENVAMSFQVLADRIGR